MGREKTGGSRAVKPFLSPSGGGCPSGGGGLNRPQERTPYKFFYRNKKIIKSLGFFNRISFIIMFYNIPPRFTPDRASAEAVCATKIVNIFYMTKKIILPV